MEREYKLLTDDTVKSRRAHSMAKMEYNKTRARLNGKNY